MTPRDLRNIHTIRNSCKEALLCPKMAPKLPIIFTCLWRCLLVATFKFGLLTITQYSATQKQLFSYPRGEGSGFRQPKKDEHQD